MSSKPLQKLATVYITRRGSHIHLKKETPPHNRIVVPNHKELRKGTLRGILRDAGLSVEGVR
ncbi:MAG: type II toxin-antitoxin system HicA family toxin [Methanosarcinales archaeon Met12]|nr:MAG: type II toxin-antitoxin system HicA family toxin [Methanosarcinales archaeon Met12]